MELNGLRRHPHFLVFFLKTLNILGALLVKSTHYHDVRTRMPAIKRNPDWLGFEKYGDELAKFL